MGQNDSEIFSRLREIGEGVVRIDERTQRMDADMREHPQADGREYHPLRTPSHAGVLLQPAG